MILITGGAGFIGSHLAQALVKLGHGVRVLDDFSSGKEENLSELQGRVEIVKGSITDPEAVRRAMQGVKVVYHEAARPSVVLSLEQPVVSHEINATGTLRVLEAARRCGVERVVLASSSSVYGDPQVSPSHELLREDPKSPYAAQKLLSEHYCRIYSQAHRLHTVILRYYNVFGPRQDPSSPYSGVISIFCDRLLQGEAPTIFGDGQQTRDFVFVEDVVQANLLAAHADIPSATVCNVASGRSISLLSLFETLAKELRVNVRPQFAPARAGDVRHSVADIERARTLLHYEPSMSFADGLKRTLQWMQSRLAGASDSPRRGKS